jgi:hypothetical protein
MAPTPRQSWLQFTSEFLSFQGNSNITFDLSCSPYVVPSPEANKTIFYVFATPACVTRPAETIFTHSFTYCSYQCTISINTNYIIVQLLHVRHRATNRGWTKSSKMAKALKKTAQRKPHTGTRSRVELGLFKWRPVHSTATPTQSCVHHATTSVNNPRNDVG